MTRALLNTASPAACLEGRLVDQRGEVVLIRQLERGVVLVDPRDRQLQRAPGVEAGRARVGVDGRLGLRRGVEDRRPFALEEAELAHITPLDTRRRRRARRSGTA